MRHIKVYTFATVMLLSIMGCSRQEENLFDQSAFERLETREAEIKQRLVSAPNGWVMHYFPNPEAAGYDFLMKFKADNSVTIATRNSVSTKNVYKEELSHWAFDRSQSCGITFNTYNNIFSYFADPLSDGLGYEGDYEFIILTDDQNSTDYIRLKGKKHSAYINMYPLGSAQNWEQYFSAVTDLNAETFTDNDGIDMSYWDGQKSMTIIYNNGQFSWMNSEEVEEVRGFVVTRDCVHFYSGLPIANSNALAGDFRLTDDKQMLKTADGKCYISSNYTAADFFTYKCTKNCRWVYIADDSDATTQAAVNNIIQLASAKGAEINNIAYERKVTEDSRGARSYSYALHISYLVNNKQFSGRINLTSSKSGEDLVLSFVDYEDALQPLFARIAASSDAGAAMFTDIFCGTFTPLSYTGSALNMSQLLLQKAGGTSIHIKADKIIM